MHSWDDTSVDWKGLNDAAVYIGEGLKRWGRVSVLQYKEKWGTVRVYCSFGWNGIYDIVKPGYTSIKHGSKYTQWLYNFTYTRVGQWIMRPLNLLVIPYQKQIYKYLYKQAVKRWPHLRLEILSGADYPELLGHLGVHRIKTGERTYEIYYDWHFNDNKQQLPDRSEQQ